MNCVNHPDAPAHADYQWRTDALGTQTATLCRACGESLWDMLRSLLCLNRATLRIDAPGSMRRVEE